MPHGRFSPAESAYAVRAIEQSIQRRNEQEKTLQEALRLIKTHITSEHTEQNRDLHNAIGKIVDVARAHGFLTR